MKTALLPLALLCAGSLSSHAQDKLQLPAAPLPVFTLHYGAALDISGERLIIGSQGTRSVRIYERGPADWHEAAELDASFVAGLSGQMGMDVAIDGDLVVIGDNNAVDAAGVKAGAAVVFRYVGGAWIYEATLESPSPEAGGEFGASVEVQGDNIFIGAHKEGVVGRAYAFHNSGAGAWSGVELILPPATLATIDAGAKFGFEINAYGDTLAVGCPLWDTFYSKGRIYVFDGSSGNWLFDHELGVSANTLGLGTSISMSETDSGELRMASGGAKPGVFITHRAVVFERSLPGTAFHYTGAIETPTASTDDFGFAVSLWGDHLLIGASGDDDIAGAAGAFYLYKITGGTWTMLSKFTNPTGGYLALLGSAVALAPGVLVAGEPKGDQAGPGKGGAIVMHTGVESDFFASPWKISLAAGGTQTLRIRAEVAHAGDIGLIVGSFSEYAPGLVIDSATVYLGVDAYSMYLLTNLAVAPFAGLFGVLDAEGKMQGTITMPPASDPALAGLALYHAALVFDAVTGLAELGTSNESLLLVP